MEGAREEAWVKAIAETIKGERVIHKLSQDALAERIGVDRNTLGHWEAGRREPGVGKLARIAHVFGLEYIEFVQRAQMRLRPDDEKRPIPNAGGGPVGA